MNDTPPSIPNADAGPDDPRPFPLFRRTVENGALMGLVEALTLCLCLFLGGLLRSLWKGDPMFASWMWFLVTAWVVGAVVARLLPGWGLGPVEELRRTVLLLAVVFGGTTAMLFWGKSAGETSRFTLTTAFALSLFLVPLARTSLKRRLLSWNRWGTPSAIYGNQATAAQVIANLQEEKGLGFLPVAVFLDDPSPPSRVGGVPVRGDLRAATARAPSAIVALPDLPSHALSELLEGPLAGYRKVVIIPDLQETPSLWVKPRDLVGMLGLEISINLLDPLARLIKRSVDMAIVLLASPLWVPLCAVVAAAIWLSDRGRPLFEQERMGRNGKTFVTWKFRTMHPDAERILRERLAVDEELRREWETNFKLRKDPRITRLGAFLRRTSIDELPQLLNVLSGEMSLVGPRPLPAYHYEQLPARVRALRDRVRPGITGLWQVSGRSDAGHAGMARWDTYYVRNWSMWLDIVILVRTFRAVVTGRGAF